MNGTSISSPCTRLESLPIAPCSPSETPWSETTATQVFDSPSWSSRVRKRPSQASSRVISAAYIACASFSVWREMSPARPAGVVNGITGR